MISSSKQQRNIIEKYAFSESFINIEKSIDEEKWQVVSKDGATPIKHKVIRPLSILEKRWLKAIALDPRKKLFTDEIKGLEDVEPLFALEDICYFDRFLDGDPFESEEYTRMKLFTDEIKGLEDVEPLFALEDICYFDRFLDGDPFESEEYIKNFRTILKAIKKNQIIKIEMKTGKGREVVQFFKPEVLEYSSKDDKFRLVGVGSGNMNIVNLARITFCESLGKDEIDKKVFENKKRKIIKDSVTFELIDKRNALDRIMLHFAHFQKGAEKIDSNKYRVTVNYDKDDETEMVIRILSFGPMIKVTSPDYFVEQIKDRLKQQKILEI